MECSILDFGDMQGNIDNAWSFAQYIANNKSVTGKIVLVVLALLVYQVQVQSRSVWNVVNTK